MDLLNRETTFYFSATGFKSKKKYEGNFTVKTVLTNGEQVLVALRTDQYNGGSTSLPSAYSQFNRAIAELEVRMVTKAGIQQAPSWWKDSDGGRNLIDANLVTEVLDMATKKGDEAFEKLLGEQIASAEQAEKKEKT
jgi:ssRNA-specific RNase YbeY (16S rRNA maturation enzyme)